MIVQRSANGNKKTKSFRYNTASSKNVSFMKSLEYPEPKFSKRGRKKDKTLFVMEEYFFEIISASAIGRISIIFGKNHEQLKNLSKDTNFYFR